MLSEWRKVLLYMTAYPNTHKARLIGYCKTFEQHFIVLN